MKLIAVLLESRTCEKATPFVYVSWYVVYKINEAE